MMVSCPGESILTGTTCRERLHRTEVGPTASAAESDKRAGRIDRKRGDVAAVCDPHLCWRLECLLDVRHVEGGDRRRALLQVLRNCPQCLRARKVSDNRNDQVLLLHLPHKLIVGLAGQKVPIAPCPSVMRINSR